MDERTPPGPLHLPLIGVDDHDDGTGYGDGDGDAKAASSAVDR